MRSNWESPACGSERPGSEVQGNVWYVCPSYSRSIAFECRQRSSHEAAPRRPEHRATFGILDGKSPAWSSRAAPHPVPSTPTNTLTVYRAWEIAAPLWGLHEAGGCSHYIDYRNPSGSAVLDKRSEVCHRWSSDLYDLLCTRCWNETHASQANMPKGHDSRGFVLDREQSESQHLEPE